MARALSLGNVAAVLLAAALLAVPQARLEAASPSSTLVRYSFDDEDLATGPDTFAVFEKAKGRVHLSTAFRTSGYRSVEIRDVADDGNFPELQGYFPLRETGTLYAHFALMMADPLEQLNIALAGPAWFTFKKGGVAFWLQTRGGALYHYSDSIPIRLLPLRPFTWYLVDLAYDVGAGTYDLAIREEGRAGTLVSLRAQPNAFNEPGSAVDKFSFIGDNGHDTSNVDYYVDDILLTLDRPIPLAPFVAPGRRKLFFDTWSDLRLHVRARPSCLPALGLDDFGLTPDDVSGLKRDGLLPALETMLEGRPVPLAAGGSTGGARALKAIGAWQSGCAALARGEAPRALELFTVAAESGQRAAFYEASAVLALAALGRRDEADVRLSGVYAAWRDDPRLPLLLAMIALSRGDPAAAEQPLRPPAEGVPDDPRSECALVAVSRRIDPGLVRMIQGRFPDDWRACLHEALRPEEYFDVLLLRQAYREASRYAKRTADHMKAMSLPAADWLERQGDAAFLAGEAQDALRLWETSADGAAPHVALMLKLSDAHHLLGDLTKERAYREAIYGSLHEELDHTPQEDPREEKVREAKD
ncbi:MAG TPA: hypothetical protein VGV60_16950 [Candidatus Polarisedimenticolia bacterium]|nr:hypothetical protein [Candidatus Polarisedimenticolia bacterium]